MLKGAPKTNTGASKTNTGASVAPGTSGAKPVASGAKPVTSGAQRNKPPSRAPPKRIKVTLLPEEQSNIPITR